MWVITGMLVCLTLLLITNIWEMLDKRRNNVDNARQLKNHQARLKNLEGVAHKHVKAKKVQER